MAVVKVPGVEVTLGGEKMVMAPLTAGPLKQILPQLERVTDMSVAEQLDLAVDVAYHSLRRNYPDIERDRVENDLVDLANMGEVIAAATMVSQLVPAEGKAPKAKSGKR